MVHISRRQRTRESCWSLVVQFATGGQSRASPGHAPTSPNVTRLESFAGFHPIHVHWDVDSEPRVEASAQSQCLRYSLPPGTPLHITAKTSAEARKLRRMDLLTMIDIPWRTNQLCAKELPGMRVVDQMAASSAMRSRLKSNRPDRKTSLSLAAGGMARYESSLRENLLWQIKYEIEASKRERKRSKRNLR